MSNADVFAIGAMVMVIAWLIACARLTRGKSLPEAWPVWQTGMTMLIFAFMLSAAAFLLPPFQTVQGQWYVMLAGG
jgi:uncharacterized membrane protein YczE